MPNAGKWGQGQEKPDLWSSAFPESGLDFYLGARAMFPLWLTFVDTEVLRELLMYLLFVLEIG
jgi:hypothetical protein